MNDWHFEYLTDSELYFTNKYTKNLSRKYEKVFKDIEDSANVRRKEIDAILVQRKGLCSK